MPVSQTSRYNGLPVYQAADSKGNIHATIAVRLAPALTPQASTYQHIMVGLETLESAAADYFRASDAWWRIADANPLQFPLDWRPGMSLSLPSLANSGQITRSRRF